VVVWSVWLLLHAWALRIGQRRDSVGSAPPSPSLLHPRPARSWPGQRRVRPWRAADRPL